MHNTDNKALYKFIKCVLAQLNVAAIGQHGCQTIAIKLSLHVFVDRPEMSTLNPDPAR